MKLKTLKDIGNKEKEQWEGYHILKALGRLEQLTRQEAVKWIKEDKIDLERLHQEDKGTWTILMMRWMKRLNITEEDLE